MCIYIYTQRICHSSFYVANYAKQRTTPPLTPRLHQQFSEPLFLKGTWYNIVWLNIFLQKSMSLSNLVGLELNEIGKVRVMVVSRPRSQVVIVDKPGLTFSSITDKNVKLFIPRGSFDSRTSVRLLVRHRNNFVKTISAVIVNGLLLNEKQALFDVTCKLTCYYLYQIYRQFYAKAIYWSLLNTC